MIITQLKGGLGNQLFQYAIARNIALKNNVSVKMDLSFFDTYEWHVYSLAPFNIQENFATTSECKKIKDAQPSLYERFKRKIFNIPIHPNIIEESHFYFEQKYLDLKKNKYLIGYWQSEKYFKDIESLIREEFKVKRLPSIENKKMLDKITSTNSVSLHVRRGNYVTDEKTNEFHGTCSLEYYTNAIKHIRETVKDPIFYIFSNDIEWCKENLIFTGEKVFVDLNDDKTDYEDLRLMQNCNHHILANSSFSWWGAWLCNNENKIVIYPEQWFANKQWQSEIRDLHPSTWLKF